MTDYLRQLDILNPNMITFPVTLVGCGGIGSPAALLLAKMGCSQITLIDDDTVEDHNLPNQVYPLTAVGKTKVQACKTMIKSFADCQVKVIPQKFSGQFKLSGVVISGLDSMKARKAVWEAVKFNVDVPLYIDGRIGGEVLQVFTVLPSQIEDIEFYEPALFSDEEAQELPCTARAIMYTGFVIAGIIASQLKKWLKQESYFRKICFDLKTTTQILQ